MKFQPNRAEPPFAANDRNSPVMLAELTDQAARCRRLASATHDREAARMLAAMASDYERAADALKR
jgi:hypothetical protein